MIIVFGNISITNASASECGGERSERDRIVRNVGFGCALVATVLMLSASLENSVTLGNLSMPVVLPVLVLAMVLLFLAARANDLLITAHGLTTLKLCVLLGGLGPLLLLLKATLLIGIVVMAVFIAASVLLWGSALAYYERTELLLTTALSFLAVGVALMFGLGMKAVAMPLASVAALLSGLGTFISRINPLKQSIRIDLAVSRFYGNAGRGNRFTIVAIGMSVGCAMLMGFALPFDAVLISVVVGAVVVAASLATVFFRARFKQAYEDLARRTIAVFTTFSILPYPFVNDDLRLVCVCVLVVSATVNSIILIDAIAETARLKRVSPYWIVGDEGAFFMLGMFMALLLLWYFLLIGSEQAATTICIVFAIIFMALQVFIEGQTYPYFDSVVEEDARGYLEQAERREGLLASGGTKWRERMDEVSAEHKLSPRQQEVMRLLLKGRDIRYIMNKFVISRATAKTHVYNLYKKLNIHSRSELLDLIEQAPPKDSS
jgi:DNA-binding CsgD family transcriptional regulator